MRNGKLVKTLYMIKHNESGLLWVSKSGKCGWCSEGAAKIAFANASYQGPRFNEQTEFSIHRVSVEDE